MQKYETLFVLQPDLTEERMDEIVQQFGAIIPDSKGNLIRTDKWGKRRLAFRVGRHQEGYYTLYEYEGDGEIQKELERRMKIHDDVIRFLTTRVDPRMEAEVARKAEREKRAEGRSERFSRDRDDDAPRPRRSRDDDDDEENDG